LHDGARSLDVQAHLGREQLEERVAIVGDVRPGHGAFVKVNACGDLTVADHQLAVGLCASVAQRAQHV
jgi:hypothetical protein